MNERLTMRSILFWGAMTTFRALPLIVHVSALQLIGRHNEAHARADKYGIELRDWYVKKVERP